MRKIFSWAIFFILVFNMLPLSGGIPFTRAKSETIEEKEVVFYIDEKEFNYSYCELGYEENEVFDLSIKELLVRVHNMGFGVKTTMNYVFKNLDSVLGEISKEVDVLAQDSKIEVETGRAVVTAEKEGQMIDKELVYRDLFIKILNCEDNVPVKVELKTKVVSPTIFKEENEAFTFEKSYFRTYITGNNQEGRIHNIKHALNKFNGMRIDPGERVSFNKVIGETTEENGYKKAKVILNGKYADDYGGGVCQAATTLYNAALEAGLEIEKVSPHSLKVGYVMGSFDAMVAGEFSDLVIKNPFNEPVFIHTYATDQECGVKIFGKENDFKIVRRSEKVEFSEEEFPNVQFKTVGHLDYYRGDELVETKQIRSDNYFKLKLDEKPLTSHEPS